MVLVVISGFRVVIVTVVVNSGPGVVKVPSVVNSGPVGFDVAGVFPGVVEACDVVESDVVVSSGFSVVIVLEVVVDSGVRVVDVVVGVVCPVDTVNSGFNVVSIAVVVSSGPGVLKVLAVVNSGLVGFDVTNVVSEVCADDVGGVAVVSAGFNVVIVLGEVTP